MQRQVQAMFGTERSSNAEANDWSGAVPPIQNPERDPDSELKMPKPMWNFLFGYLTDEEIDDLREQGVFKHSNLKTNDALWKYLYIQTFSETTPHSKLSIALTRVSNHGSLDQNNQTRIEGVFHEDAEVSPEVVEIYNTYRQLVPIRGANEQIVNQRAIAEKQRLIAAQESSLWFDLFQHDWNRFMHVYVSKQDHRVLRFDYPRVPEKPLLEMWLDFSYNCDASKKTEWIDFGKTIREKHDVSLAEACVLKNLFRNKGVVVQFRYMPTIKEAVPGSQIKRIVSTFMIGPDFEQLETTNKEIAQLLAESNQRKRPPIVNIDLSQDPINVTLENASFLGQQPMHTDFSIGVFITKQGKPFNERTVTYKYENNMQVQANTISGSANNCVLHEIDTANIDKQKNSEQSQQLQKLLTVSHSALQQQ